MFPDAQEKDFLPLKAPKILIAIGLLFAGLALVISPALFIKLGPMRGSLLSEIDFVRQIALLEIWGARILFGLIGGLAILCWVFWGRLRSSTFVAHLVQHQPLMALPSSRSTKTFWWIAGLVLVSMVWIAASSRIPALMPGIVFKEDGLIEYLTAFIFLIAAFWSMHIAYIASSRPRRLVHAILAVGFVLCFGEEISWGQRILDFSTPEIVKSVNAQSEFNIHNSFGYAADHIFIVGIFFCGFVMPMMAHHMAFFRNLFDKLGLPIASVGLAWGFAIISGIHSWTVYVVLPYTQLRPAELRELFSVLALLILMLEVSKTIRAAQNREEQALNYMPAKI